MEHYGTIEGALAYHQARGDVTWNADGVTEDQQTAALIRASNAIDGLYGDQFPGKKTGGRNQTLAWPRTGARDHCADEAIPDTEIPLGVEYATYTAALQELIQPGSLAPIVTPGRVTKREKVDSIEREFFGPESGPGANSMRPVLSAVEDALRCLLSASGGGQVFLLRY